MPVPPMLAKLARELPRGEYLFEPKWDGVRQGRELVDELAPRVVPLEGHPRERGFLLGGGAVGRLRGAAGRWQPGMTMDWVPAAPELLAEVAYDQVDERRFRHPTRFRRRRPDRDARSCTFDQLR